MGLWNGIGAGIGRKKRGIDWSSYWKTQHPELAAYDAALTTPMTEAQIIRLGEMLHTIKTGLSITAMSEFFDTFYVRANEGTEAHVRNLVKDAHHITATAAPTYTEFKGVKGNGSSQFEDTNYNPNTEGENFTQNDASIGCYITTQDSDFEANYFVCGVEDGTRYIRLMPAGTSYVHYYINSGLVNIYGESSLPGSGMLIVSRTAANVIKVFSNGKEAFSATHASNGVPNGNIYLLARNVIGTGASLFSDAEIGFFFTSKGMTEAQSLVITNAIQTYMEAVNYDKIIKITEPTLVLTFDDGNAEHATLTKNMFLSKGVSTTFYITTDWIGDVGRMTVANLQDLNANGFDIQCHSFDHTNLISLTSAQVRTQYDNVNTFFTTNSLPTPKHTAYPGGAYDGKVRMSTAQRRVTGRTIGNEGIIHTGNIALNYNIITAKSIDSLTSGAGVNTIKTLIDAAKAANGLIVFYGHGVYQDDPEESAYPSPASITAIGEVIDYALSVGVAVKSMSELYDDNTD